MEEKRQLNPMRFMQIALGTTILFSLVYMWQFVTLNVLQIDSLASTTKNRLLGQTKIVLQGFDEGYKFVSEYDVQTQGPLYILFMSDVDENGKYWCSDCDRAKNVIYAGFERAPYGSRIVEIRIGPESYWADFMNPFRQNQLFYIDRIPSLMRYDGGGNSSALLLEKYCLDDNLLDYVFRVRKPAAGVPNNNKVVTMYKPTEVMEYMDAYDNSYPLFVFFVSGFHSFNGRLWCPYCDRADVSIMHYYNYTAPDSAVMLRVVVSHSYKKWKKKKHPFKRPPFKDQVVELRGVPYLGFVTKDMEANKVTVKQYFPEFYVTDKLKEWFLQVPPQQQQAPGQQLPAP